MEAVLATTEDVLIPNIDLRTNPGASYVTKRRQATFFSSIPTAKFTGVQTIKFNVSSATEWCDPATALVSFVVRNTHDTKALVPATVGAHCLFDRYQCRMGNALVEDVEHFARTTEVMETLVPPQKRLNWGGLGFDTLTGSAHMDRAENHHGFGISANKTRRVYMRLAISGIFGGQKWIPLWALGGGGCEILLTLAPVDEAFLKGASGGANSQDFQLEDIRFECDMLTLDSQLQETFYQNLLKGSALTLHYKSFQTVLQFIPDANSGNFDLAIHRSLSKLGTVFVTFSIEQTAEETWSNSYAERCDFPKDNGTSDYKETVESWIQVGATRWPDFNIVGSAQHYWRLLMALGVFNSLPHDISVLRADYENLTFVAAYDLEKVPAVASSGESLAAGNDLQLHFRGFGGNNAQANTMRRAWVTLHYDQIVEIKSTGVHVLE